MKAGFAKEMVPAARPTGSQLRGPGPTGLAAHAHDFACPPSGPVVSANNNLQTPNSLLVSSPLSDLISKQPQKI